MESSNSPSENKPIRGQSHRIKTSHLNVRSLKNREHFHQVSDFINNSDFDVLTVSELASTLLCVIMKIISLVTVFLDSTELRGEVQASVLMSGVCLKLAFYGTLPQHPTNMVTVQHKKLKPLVVCYRHSDVPFASFAGDLASTYSQAATLGKDIVILGDLNCDMLSPTKPECCIISELCSLLNLI